MSRPHYWVERDGVPVPVDMMDWATSKNGLGTPVGKTYRGDGQVLISTVFLGIDHNFDPDGPPLLYETMVFGLGGEEEICERWSTRAEAAAGHEQMVAEIDARLLDRFAAIGGGGEGEGT